MGVDASEPIVRRCFAEVFGEANPSEVDVGGLCNDIRLCLEYGWDDPVLYLMFGKDLFDGELARAFAAWMTANFDPPADPPDAFHPNDRFSRQREQFH